MNEPGIAMLIGGISSEREVALGSGRACAASLGRHFPVEVFDVREPAVPAGVDPRRHVVFSTLHGKFGEDGGMQRLLEAAGIEYAGSDAAASDHCFDKERAKRTAAAAGVGVAPDRVFTADAPPSAGELVADLGSEIVFKPVREGSSVGLRVVSGIEAVANALNELEPDLWMAEPRIMGIELTVGVLGDRTLGVVEIAPRSGLFDYASKYTSGLTDYFVPARIDDETAACVKEWGALAFRACGCRDYARVDFIYSSQKGLFMLEINTLPGMKETSLLPMSAQCEGMDFDVLTRALVAPAFARFRTQTVSSA